MTRPAVALVIDRPAAPGLVQVAIALGRHARLRAGDAGDTPVAIVATSARAAGNAPLPAAAWYEPGDDVEGFDGLLLHDPGVEPPASGLTVSGTMDLRARRPLSPFLRSRWRRREGLPENLVVVAGPPGCFVEGGSAVPPAGVPSALALAAAVVATGSQLVEALAWGAPVVTSAADARDLGATPGVHVEVADQAEAVEAAGALARDWPRAAALGRAGRRLIEVTLDRDRWLAPLLSHLGLGTGRGEAHGRLEDRLAELRTLPSAPVVDRAAAAVAGWR